MTRQLAFGLVCLLCLLGQVGSQAQASWRQFDYSVSVGQRSQTNLPDLPERLLSGELQLIPSYYAAIALARPLEYDLWPHWRLDLESRLLHHMGGQRHLESAIGVVLRTPCWRLKPFCFQAGAGEGLSWAWQPPAEERGRSGELGIQSYQLQNFLLFEFAASMAPSRWQLLLQLHHRSGIYGVVSPRRTGSNYLAIGLRRRGDQH